jgi:hypothetical protein
MGGFEIIGFLSFALIPGLSTLAVLVLTFTRWRSSVFQLILSTVSLGYGIVFAYGISRISYYSFMLFLYGLPLLVGAMGLFVFARGRISKQQ